MWFRILLTSIIFLILNGCDNQIQIIDKPIIFNQERINLTKEYLKERYGEWILFDPEFNKNTYFLWLMPILMFLIGGLLIFKLFIIRKN